MDEKPILWWAQAYSLLVYCSQLSVYVFFCVIDLGVRINWQCEFASFCSANKRLYSISLLSRGVARKGMCF